MRRIPSVALLTFIALSARAPTASSQSYKLDPLASRAISMLRARASHASMKEARVVVNEADELDVFILGSVTREALEAAGAHVRTALPGVLTASVALDAIERIVSLDTVERIEGAAWADPSLDQSVPTTHADLAWNPGPGYVGHSGRGVIIGIVDTGIDYDHLDFKTPQGGTRLLRIWDQTDAGGPHPLNYGYGSEWTSADIDAHVARQIDFNGHGTHVAGIAGGSGTGTGGGVPARTFVGMAPEADLVVVKTDFSTTHIVDAVKYLDELAAERLQELVINLSLGTLYGPKDGTGGFERAINNLVTGAGRIVVVSAGNYRGKPVHAELSVSPGTSVQATLQVPNSFPKATVLIDGYYTLGSNVSVTLSSSSGTTIGPVAPGTSNAPYPGLLTSGGLLYVLNGGFDSQTDARRVYIEIGVPKPNTSGADISGTWTLTFDARTTAPHDETTEDLQSASWNSVGGRIATPGLASGVSGFHLLISEVGMRGWNDATRGDSTEFIEIHNPTESIVDLSHYYLSDADDYYTLPLHGMIDLDGVPRDFAKRFPTGATIPPHGTKVIAVDGGRYRRNTGYNADFMLFNAGGATNAIAMIDVSTDQGAGYPALNGLDDACELVWLFRWDGVSDLVCDVDLVYWGNITCGDIPALKTGICQDGPDPDSILTCSQADAGNPPGFVEKFLAIPGSGGGTRQRVGPEAGEVRPGSGCVIDELSPPPTAVIDLWDFYDNTGGQFVIGNESGRKLVTEPGNAPDVVTVGAWTTKTSWIDCDGVMTSYPPLPDIGSLAPFSSPGPTRDGREKPDLAAPGAWIASTTTLDYPWTCGDFYGSLLQDGMQHRMMSGTSMAAPHVTGAIALLLQKYGWMNADQIKQKLFSRATVDAWTGTVWNADWGHGKLSVGDVTDPNVSIQSPNGGQILTIGSLARLSWIASDDGGELENVDLLLNRDGGESYELIASEVPNTGTFDWIVSGPVTSIARLKVVARDPVGNQGEDRSDEVFMIGSPVASIDNGASELVLGLRSFNPSSGKVEVEFSLRLDRDRAGRVRSCWSTCGNACEGRFRWRSTSSLVGNDRSWSLFREDRDACGEADEEVSGAPLNHTLCGLVVGNWRAAFFSSLHAHLCSKVPSVPFSGSCSRHSTIQSTC